MNHIDTDLMFRVLYDMRSEELLEEHRKRQKYWENVKQIYGIDTYADILSMFLSNPKYREDYGFQWNIIDYDKIKAFYDIDNYRGYIIDDDGVSVNDIMAIHFEQEVKDSYKEKL